MNCTPGPWIAQDAGEWIAIEAEGKREICMLTVDEDPDDETPNSFDEDRANARLIAAAPELMDYVLSCAGDRDDCVSPGMKKRARDLLARITT